jgi:capsular exopolysaccharide synthesis family protein
MLRKRGYLILGCTVACLLLSIFYIVLKTSYYQATARIEVSPAGTNSFGLDERSNRPSNIDPAIQLHSAVAVLQSDVIALQVMQQLGMAERQDFAGRWKQPPGTQIESLSPVARDHLLRLFHKRYFVDVVPKTDIVQVQFRARDPKLAADVVNTTVASYTQRNFRTSYDSASQVGVWLSAQMEDLKTKARQSQEQLAELQKRRGLIGVDESDNIVTEKLKELAEQLTIAESDRIVKEARHRIAASGNPELIATMVPEPTLDLLRTQQAQLRVDYARMSTKFGEGYPKVGEVTNQIAQVDQSIQTELANLAERYKNEYLAARSAEDMLRRKFEAQKQQAYALNEGAAQYAILKHDVEGTQDLYRTLELKLNQAGVAAGLASANITEVERAQIPSEPVDPRPLFDIVLSLGCGLGLGLLSAIGLEALDTTVQTQLDAEMISGIPVLAVIPSIVSPNPFHYFERRRSFSRLRDFGPIALDDPSSPAAESFRSLRTLLLLSSQYQPSKVLAVVSPFPSEGKSVIAANCAVVLAQHGERVLLVDGDLRQPSLHRTFETTRTPGLSDVLQGQLRWQDAATPSSAISNLAILSSGTTSYSPAELLASQRLQELADEWRNSYDHILIDTPPLSMLADAVLLAHCADAALLVARSCTTTREALRQSQQLLNRAGINIAGLVLNGAPQNYERYYYFSSGSSPVHEIYPGETYN